MSKNKFTATYKKHKHGYKIYIKGNVHETIFWFSQKYQCIYICELLKKVYDQGRYDEFTDNNKKCKSLMKKFAL